MELRTNIKFVVNKFKDKKIYRIIIIKNIIEKINKIIIIENFTYIKQENIKLFI